MSSTHPSFDPEDSQILSTLVPEGAEPGSPADAPPPEEAPPANAPAPSPEPTPAPTPAPQEANATPAPTPEPTPAPTPAPQGDARAALRASRRQEKMLRDRVQQLEQQLADVKAGKSTESLELTPEEEEELKRDYPAQYKLHQQVKQFNEQLSQQAPAPTSNEFQPRLAPPEVQVLIDEVPQLVAWQHDPQAQDKFDKAIEYDEALRLDPDWKGRTVVERFNEAARRAAAAFGASTAAPSPAAPAAPRTDPAAVIAAAPSTGPKGISDFPGGAPGQAPTRDFNRMSDADIMASLVPED